MSELRRVDVVPAPGEIVLSRDGGGWRHFLDGEPVRCGDRLLQKIEGSTKVIPVRYESRLDGPDAAALLVYSDGSEAFARPHHRFVRAKR